MPEPSADRDVPRHRSPFVAFAGRAVIAVLFVPTFAWCLGAIWFSGVGSSGLRGVVAGAFALVVVGAWVRRATRRRAVLGFACAALVIGLLWQLKRPTNDRVWAPDMVVLPVAEFDGDLVHVRGVRHCTYRSTTDFDVRYEDQTYDLTRLRSVDFMVEEIWEWFEGSAHTLLTFGFDDGRYLAISVELRREAGEGFHPISGMYRQFELMYVIGDERDLIKLRTSHRHDTVYLYPIRTTPDERRALLADMLAGANRLHDEPEFYNTLTNSCTTRIVDHVESIAPGRVPFSYEILLPGYSGRLAWELGLVDTDLSFEAARERFRIDERARAIGDDPAFSSLIRGGD